MDLFEWVAERKRRRLTEEEAREGTVTEFWVYDRPLETAPLFKYLGRLLTTTNNDWSVFISTIWKARKSWYHLDRILGRKGTDNQTSGRFYVALV